MDVSDSEEYEEYCARAIAEWSEIQKAICYGCKPHSSLVAVTLNMIVLCQTEDNSRDLLTGERLARIKRGLDCLADYFAGGE